MSDEMRVQQLREGFQWPAEALQPADQVSPHSLHGLIIPTVDLVQGGWGHVATRTEPFFWEKTVAEVSAAVTLDLVTGVDVAVTPSAPPAGWFTIITSLSAQLTGNLPVDAWLQYRAGPTGGAIIHSRVSIPSTQAAGGSEFLCLGAGSAQWLPWGPLRVPVGFSSQMRLFASLADSGTLTVTGAVTYMRAGFSGEGSR